MAKSPLTLPPERGAPRRATSARDVALLLIAAFAVGVGSAWALVRERPPFGAVALGPWVSRQALGSAAIDPYSRALLAREPRLPLALGEGVTLIAHVDDTGAPLVGWCVYILSGPTLPARAWTLSLVDRSDATVPGGAALSDADALVEEGGVVRVMVAATAQPGVWLKVPGDQRFGLALRFYDTALAAGVGQLNAAALPGISLVRCRN